MTRILFTVGGQMAGGGIAGSKVIESGIEIADSFLRAAEPKTAIGEKVTGTKCPRHNETALVVIVDELEGKLRLRVAKLCGNSDWCDDLVGAIRDALKSEA